MADVFAFKFNKIKLKPTNSAHILLWSILALGFAACNQNHNKQHVLPTAISKDSLTSVSTSKQSEIEINKNPPTEMVLGLKKEAPYILLINVSRVDSIYNAEKVFSANIIKSFKGNLKSMDSLKYMAMSDLKYVKYPNDTLIVFLKKNKSSLLSSKNKDVFYFALENASFRSTKYLDSLLTKK
ncbi:hypothetical protein ASE74_23960 [Pedobacter sp. Leaf216]|uniref:hypothetical protein n=1 Tax=Pedobacter sp. Leaf216 TaxID=1735684 RepID=UPI0006F6AFD8|nr:hypothetical protein [Pedobacter sp. Leaf216]KQM68535.1 hypothetical protein ASE74_23960 [Pedobacter sp. Leaf216]